MYINHWIVFIQRWKPSWQIIYYLSNLFWWNMYKTHYQMSIFWQIIWKTINYFLHWDFDEKNRFAFFFSQVMWLKFFLQINKNFSVKCNFFYKDVWENKTFGSNFSMSCRNIFFLLSNYHLAISPKCVKNWPVHFKWRKMLKVQNLFTQKCVFKNFFATQMLIISK